MKFLKNNLVTILFALAGVLFLVRPVKQLIKGEPLSETDIVFALAYFALAVVFLAVAVGRKSAGGSDAPRASQGTSGGEQ